MNNIIKIKNKNEEKYYSTEIIRTYSLNFFQDITDKNIFTYIQYCLYIQYHYRHTNF
jgi:hypothetical protein